MAKTKKVLRVGIIGQGRSGYDIHAAHLRTDKKYQIVAVSDPLAERCAQAEKEFKAAAYQDYRKMLQHTDLDLVVNATPTHLHVPVTLEAFRAGHNVLVDKPLARHVKDVDRLIAAAKKAKKMLAIFQQSRFAPHYVQLRKVIDSGVLGRIVMVKVFYNGFSRRWDWQTLQSRDGGSLLNTGPHPVDQLLQIFGPGKPKVTCVMDRCCTFGDAEDHVKLLLTGKDRPTIDLEISACCAYPKDDFQVYGTCGGLRGTSAEMQWKYFNPRRAPKQELMAEPMPGRGWCSEELPWVEKTWTVPKSKADTFPYMAKEFYSHLYETMAQHAPLVITPEQVRQQIGVIEECHRQNPLSRMKIKACRK